MPRRFVEVHPLESTQVAARRVFLHHRGAAARALRRPGQGRLRGRDSRHHHLHRACRRLHLRPLQRHPATGYRPTAHPWRHLRPWLRRPRHTRHFAPVPLLGHPVGQPRHAVDGCGSRQRRLHLQRAAPVAALRQSGHTGRRLRHQPGASGHLCAGDLWRRPLPRVCAQATERHEDGREDPTADGQDAQGHLGDTVQRGGSHLPPPPGMADGRPLSAGGHRPGAADVSRRGARLRHEELQLPNRLLRPDA